MHDPVAKAKALQEKALKRSQEAREQAKQEKAMLWRRVQAEAPDIADFLTQLNEQFGKPANVKIEFFSDR